MKKLSVSCAKYSLLTAPAKLVVVVQRKVVHAVVDDAGGHLCHSTHVTSYFLTSSLIMGRTKPKKKQHLAKSQSEPSIPKEQPSVAALTQKAQELIIQCDYELALRFARRILDQDPSNVEAKEMAGVCLLETGELDEAKQVSSVLFSSVLNLISRVEKAFQSLIPPSPGAPAIPPPSAHLYLAQLSEDDPRGALQHYQSAVNILTAQLKGKDKAMDGSTSDDELELKSNIVRALVGQVEIWMDPQYDLWYVESSLSP